MCRGWAGGKEKKGWLLRSLPLKRFVLFHDSRPELLASPIDFKKEAQKDVVGGGKANRVTNSKEQGNEWGQVKTGGWAPVTLHIF